ncbi:hypothetical protein [Streptomyces sp. NPDC001741]|uniref:hypothetical protein n=1 Tax=Streptomyces sp. NPDC001741 TaxID=3364605 RepID=UPI0036CA797F
MRAPSLKIHCTAALRKELHVTEAAQGLLDSLRFEEFKKAFGGSFICGLQTDAMARRIVLGDEKIGMGVNSEGDLCCSDGGVHDFSGSPAYLVALHRPVAPTSTGARLAVTESAESIVVDGIAFTPGATVGLTFTVIGSGATTASATVDDQGTFRHMATNVVAIDAPGTVLAQEDGGRSATGRLRSFPPRS